MHWWYFPDSYDCCIPAESAPADLEPDKELRGKSQLDLQYGLAEKLIWRHDSALL